MGGIALGGISSTPQLVSSRSAANTRVNLRISVLRAVVRIRWGDARRALLALLQRLFRLGLVSRVSQNIVHNLVNLLEERPLLGNSSSMFYPDTIREPVEKYASRESDPEQVFL
jgi:hypothetical protein